MWNNLKGSSFVAENRRKRGSAIAEFPLALWLVFFAFFPLLSLLSLLYGVSTLSFATETAARTVGASNSYSEAIGLLNNPNSQVSQLIKLGNAFCTVTPENISGMTLSVEVTDPRDDRGNPDAYSVTSIPPEAYDPRDFQYRITSRYSFLSILNFKDVPGLQDISFIGKPAQLSFTARSHVERREGLYL